MRRFTKKPSMPGHQIAGPYHAEARRRIVPSDPRAHRTPSKASPASIEQITPPAIAIAVCSTRRFRMFVNSPPALEVSRRKNVPSRGHPLSSGYSAGCEPTKSHRTDCRKAAKRLSRDWVRSIASLTLAFQPGARLSNHLDTVDALAPLPLCGLPSEARCLPKRCRPATHCLKANRR